MKIGVLGTGMVGQTLAAKLAGLGHEVMIGTRDPAETARRSQPDRGGQSFSDWLKQNPSVKLGSYPEVAMHGEVVINATNGMGSLEALRQAGAANLNGKVLIDISNPLDFSRGMPPTLTVCNTDSLAEQIQREFPQAKVVKTLNTITAALMVNPGLVAGGDHTLFVSGNDTGAKAHVIGWLVEWFGWQNFIDLGDITTARGTEMYLPLWLRLWGALGTGMVNVKVMK